ncbi:hypothetical protein Tco_1145566 [Tanacetum coccineum]
MVAFLEKSTGSAGFHPIIDFITRSHICYALTKKPEVCVSFIQQFWRSAETLTDDNGTVKIHATIDGHSLSITEGSLRRHLKLDDQDGITSLPTTEIFAQLALMGYATNSDKLTFQKGAFSPQWRFLIHNILHCLSPKKTAWEQFSSNIAAAVICLATNRKFNFSRMIFDHMVSNISSPHKFLMYPRFIQLCLDMQRHKLQQHTRVYSVPSLTMKVFSNMKRITKGFTGQEVALFPNMLAVPTPSASPSNSISSPESTHTQPSPQPSPPQPSPTQPSPTHLGSEYHPPTPHDSPLHAVHSHGSDEGSLKLQELMNLINTLSDRVGVLEADLTKTKKTYSSAYTKLILRVKKLEAQLKVGKARRHSRFVISDTEIGEDDSSKQGRKFSNEGVQDDEGVHEKASNDTELFVQEVTPTELIQDQEGSGKASDEVSTAGLKKGTAREEVPTVSTAEATLSTAGGTVTYSRRSAEKRSRKDKGKAILIEEEPKKKSKKDIEQEKLSFTEAIRLEEQMHEEQRAQIARDAEIARQWDEEERKRAMDEWYERISKKRTKNEAKTAITGWMESRKRTQRQAKAWKTQKPHKSYAPTSKQSSSTRSIASTKHKGKDIAKPITPSSKSASEEDSDPEQAQRDKDMQKNLTLVAVRKPKRVKDYTYHKEKMLCKQAEKGIPLQADQADWIKGTDEEIDEQELEAHYDFTAKIQEVNSSVIPDSPDMSDNDIQTDQNAEDERAVLSVVVMRWCDKDGNEAVVTRRDGGGGEGERMVVVVVLRGWRLSYDGGLFRDDGDACH